MVIKLLGLVIVIAYLLVEGFEIYRGTKDKHYHQTYCHLGATAFLILIQVIYEKKYKEDIFHDALNTKYSWVGIEENQLKEFLNANKKTTLDLQFKILDTFKVYKNGSKIEKNKKIQRDLKLFEELDKMKKTNEINHRVEQASKCD